MTFLLVRLHKTPLYAHKCYLPVHQLIVMLMEATILACQPDSTPGVRLEFGKLVDGLSADTSLGYQCFVPSCVLAIESGLLQVRQ